MSVNNIDKQDINKICDALEQIIDKIQTYNDYKLDEQYEGTVTFKYNTDNVYVPIISNLEYVLKALKDINEYRRHLSRYGDNKAYLLDTKNKTYYTPEEVTKLQNDYTFISTFEEEDRFIRVINEQSIINKLEDCLDVILYLINDK